MVNSIVMENNYVPGDASDSNTLLGQVQQYINNNVKSSLLVNPEVEIETHDSLGNTFDNERVQYGNTATVTVKGELVWLMPLINIKNEYLTDGVAGLDGTYGANAVVGDDGVRDSRGFNNYYDASTGTEVNNYDASTVGDHGARTEIRFEYSIPCMKYYADIAE